MPNAFNFQASPFDCLSPAQQQLVRDHVDIAYFRADQKYTTVVTAEGEALLRSSLRELLPRLDGNTFKSSHSVDKRPMVADIGYGVALHRGHWRFALARYHRTREFDGQEDIPVYGTFTIGRHF